MTLKVYPDEIKVKEDGLTVSAYTNSLNHKKVQAFIPINSSQELAEFRNVKSDFNFEIIGNMEPLDQPTNVNQFDLRRIMYGKGVYFKLTHVKLKKSQRLKSTGILSKIHGWRKKLIQRCKKFSEPLKSYCLGIILGEQTDFFKDNSDKLRNMGIIHLFCISGLHVFYFIKLIEYAAGLLRIPQETIENIQIAILPIYYFLGGGSTSLLRAVMLVLVQLILKKIALINLNALDGWCMVLLFNLWINPFVLLQMGGQLSYLLSFVLIMLPTDSNFKISVKLFLVELPIIIYSTYKIHLLTMLFNMIVVPIFSSVIVPIVIIAFAIPSIMSILNPLIILFETFLSKLNYLPGLIQVGKPSRLLVMVSIVIALKIIVINQQRLKKTLKKVYCLCWVGTWMYFKLIPFGEITFFDVGQGDSILIREPFNKSITLVDTGGKVQFGKSGRHQQHYIAKESSINYLQSIGISKIDNLCLTHQDMDHIGETSEILKSFKVQKLIFPLGVENTNNYQKQIVPYLQGTKVISCLNSTQIRNFPMQILYPFQPGKGENGDSLVLKGFLGRKSFLLTGDLDIQGEQKMVDAGILNQHIDIFKLGHHGSKTSSSLNILKAITPNLAIISAGRNNRYGHPHQEVLERLNILHINYASTQNRGMISYRYFFNDMGRWKTGIDKKGSIIQ